MNTLDAAYEVLGKAGEPLPYREITSRILAAGLWESHGATPEATINARLATDIKKHGAESRFQRTGKGVFALREWGMPEFAPVKGGQTSAATPPTAPPKAMSFTGSLNAF